MSPPGDRDGELSIKAAVAGMDALSRLVERLMPFGNANTSVILLSPVLVRLIVSLCLE